MVDPDSNEVQTNVISGNLICQGNTPAAQVNPAPPDLGQPNAVGGQKIGQCADSDAHVSARLHTTTKDDKGGPL